MELSSQEGEIPMPLNGSYGKDHGLGLGHIIPSSTLQNPSNGPISTIMEDPLPYTNIKKETVRYKECLKNHAAAIGGNAIDGCGEFMPSGEEGTLEALICSACTCHRNFHRKEMDGYDQFYHQRRVFLGHHHKSLGYPTRSVTPNQMIRAVGSFPSESDEQEENGGMILARPTHYLKKRFRTKFTQEQKEKMLNFAEKIGWKIQNQEENVVHQFCQEIGVKKRVLKVWMHNNKLNLAKNSISTTSAQK